MDYYAAVRAFLLAAASGSFSKAAEGLKVKTSTVSRYITDLESDLGIALFNRSTRGLVPTEGGRIFREHAALAIKALDDARDVTSSLNASPKGLLRVTVPTAFGRRHIVRHLPRFLETYPDIDVDLIFSDDILNIIDTGIDLAIRIGVLPDSQLIARRLCAHRRVVCASPGYVRQYGAPATLEELSSHEAIRFTIATAEQWRLAHHVSGNYSGKEVDISLQGRVLANDTEAILDLAIAGCGIALLPAWSIETALQTGELIHLLPEWDVLTKRRDPAVWAVYAPKKTVSSKVRSFVDFYAEVLGHDTAPLR